MTYARLYYRVPFSETDAMGIVHHANHPLYLERGRVDFLRLAGMPYTAVMKEGFHFPVTEMKLCYKRPLKFDDIVIVETSITELTKVRLNFAYRLFVGTQEHPSQLHNEAIEGTPSVVGETFHCAVNDAGRPVPMSANILEKLIQLKGQQ